MYNIFSVAAFLYFILFSVFELRFLSSIWVSHQNNRNVSVNEFYRRFSWNNFWGKLKRFWRRISQNAGGNTMRENDPDEADDNDLNNGVRYQESGSLYVKFCMFFPGKKKKITQHKISLLFLFLRWNIGLFIWELQTL